MSTRAPPGGAERRAAPRSGAGSAALGVLYRTERWVGGHVRGFYAALGAFLLVGLGLSLAALLGFALLARDAAGGAVADLDVAVLRWLHAHGSTVGDALALLGAALGSGAALWVALVAGSLYFWRSGHLYSLGLLWVALAGGRLLNRVLKDAFARPRPRLFGDEIQLLGRVFDYPVSHSFPSGHALTAMVVYGTLAYLIVRLEPTRRMRRATLLGAALLILGIGLSRLYLGVHFPSDVIAGYLAGFIWASFAAFGVEVVRYLRGRKPEVGRREADLERGVRPIGDALGGGER